MATSFHRPRCRAPRPGGTKPLRRLRCARYNTPTHRARYLWLGRAGAVALCVLVPVVAGPPRNKPVDPDEEPVPVTVFSDAEAAPSPPNPVPPAEMRTPVAAPAASLLPQKPPAVQGPPRAAPVIAKRRQTLSAEDLRKKLLGMPELHLDRGPKTSQALLNEAAVSAVRGQEYLGRALLVRRTDLAGLPFRMGDNCHLDRTDARSLQNLSRKLHEHL